MSAPASQPIDLDALPPAVREAFEAMQARVAGLEAQTERQDYLIAELRHALYGKRSEQLDPDERQLAFEDLETAVAEAEATRDVLVERNADGKPRRPAAKRNLGHLPDHLPRIEQVIEPVQKVCPCGCAEMVKIGEDRAERLDIIPARSQVIVTVRPRYACRRCDAGITQAATPNWLIEGGLPTEGTLAHVAVSKYADHLPLYRQCQIYSRGGVDLDRSTLASWCGTAAYHLAPVVDRMLTHLKRSGRLFMDETPAPVLAPKTGKTKTGYLWALTRDDRGWGGADPPAVVFTYAPGRHGSHAMDVLTGFDGILQVDGYTGYNALAEPKRVGGEPLQLAYCWAHSRRKLHDIHQKDGSVIAAEGLRRIAQIYKIEASVRGRSPEERLAARQAQSAPLVTDFRLWLTHQRSCISAKSRLGEKLGYIHRHWDGLQLFLTDGRVEVDTNPVENNYSTHNSQS
jgi:Transposase and inactivated derivatives